MCLNFNYLTKCPAMGLSRFYKYADTCKQIFVEGMENMLHHKDSNIKVSCFCSVQKAYQNQLRGMTILENAIIKKYLHKNIATQIFKRCQNWL